MRVQRAFGPDNIVREEHLLFHRELRRDASVNLFVSPAPIAQAPVLRTCGARHADGGVEIAGCVGLEKQRNHCHGRVPTFSAPGLQLGLPDCADARVEDFLQFAARFGVGKDTSSQFVAAQMAVVANDFGAEQSLDFRQGGLARLDDLTGDDIGIDDRQATLTEQFGCG